jgi:hypothetical protein
LIVVSGLVPAARNRSHLTAKIDRIILPPTVRGAGVEGSRSVVAAGAGSTHALAEISSLAKLMTLIVTMT